MQAIYSHLDSDPRVRQVTLVVPSMRAGTTRSSGLVSHDFDPLVVLVIDGLALDPADLRIHVVRHFVLPDG
jgi:hypothetical protein